VTRFLRTSVVEFSQRIQVGVAIVAALLVVVANSAVEWFADPWMLVEIQSSYLRSFGPAIVVWVEDPLLLFAYCILAGCALTSVNRVLQPNRQLKTGRTILTLFWLTVVDVPIVFAYVAVCFLSPDYETYDLYSSALNTALLIALPLLAAFVLVQGGLWRKVLTGLGGLVGGMVGTALAQEAALLLVQILLGKAHG